MSLHAIEGEYVPLPTKSRAPQFEGQEVQEVRAKLSSVADLDLGDDKPLRIDQSMRLVVTARVARVDHLVDEKSGNLVRQHTLKVTDAIEVDWDSIADLVLDKP